MAKASGLKVGEHWAYRVSESQGFVEAEVTELGTGTPARCLVRFCEEGKIEWVPPTRLKVLWTDRDRFLERERAWRSLVKTPDEIEEAAVHEIFFEFLWPAAQTNRKKSRVGTVKIPDPDLVDVFMGGGLDEVLDGARAIFEDGIGNYEWSVGVEIARRVCTAKPERMMGHVRHEEARGKSDPELYEEFWRPMCNLIRSWCGVSVSSPEEELIEARREIVRLKELFTNAVALLADAGDELASFGIYKWAYPERDVDRWNEVVFHDSAKRRRWRKGLE